MRHSDIFDEFAKIAQANGLISQATPEEIQKKLEENPRMDSLDVSAIAALYGLKPDAPKDMQYKRNIIEDAHKETVVVSPSYDKINGLVENVNQRQDIIMNIINRTPDGQIINRKYAEKQLLLTLVRIGNDLDNKKKDELRILADVCLEQTATIKKKAVAHLLPIGVATGIAATIGVLWFQQHSNFNDDGFAENHNKLIAEIDDLLTSDITLGVGTVYSDNFISIMQDFKKRLEELKASYDSAITVITDLETPRTAKELMEIVKSPGNDAVINSFKSLKSILDNMNSYLYGIDGKFKQESYKIRQTKEKGLLTKNVDRLRVFRGGKGLISDDFDDVRRAIPPYVSSIKEILNLLQTAGSKIKDAERQLRQATNQDTATTDYTTPDPAQAAAAEISTAVSQLPIPSLGD